VVKVFEQFLWEAITVESRRIYVHQIKEDKPKNIEELLTFYRNYAKQPIETNRKCKSITVENTDLPLKIRLVR
jgi:hypothetical protein